MGQAASRSVHRDRLQSLTNSNATDAAAGQSMCKTVLSWPVLIWPMYTYDICRPKHVAYLSHSKRLPSSRSTAVQR